MNSATHAKQAIVFSLLVLHFEVFAVREVLRSAFRLHQIPQTVPLPNFVDVFSSANDVPPPPPPPPTVRSRTPTTITICWGAMSGGVGNVKKGFLSQSLAAKQSKHVDSWNLIMNRVSVYSGIKLQYTQMGLPSGKCFEFRIAFYTQGRWSKFSKPLRVSTTLRKWNQGTDPLSIDARCLSLRALVTASAISNDTEVSCELNGLTNPQYVAGSPDSVEMIGTLGPLSSSGRAASSRNCRYVQCRRQTANVQSVGTGRSGVVKLRTAVGAWQTALFTLLPNARLLQWTTLGGPGSSGQGSVDLVGCRAQIMSAGIANKLNVNPLTAPLQCAQVNCSVSLKPFYFCTTAAAPPANPAKTGTSPLYADPDSSIAQWITALNRQSHYNHITQRYEVLAKVTVVPAVKKSTDTMMTGNGYREAWIMTWLMRLSLGQTSPHFPIVYGFHRCDDLPDLIKKTPGGDTNDGVLSPFAFGSDGIRNAEKIKIQSGILTRRYSVLLTESFSTTLSLIASSYKDWSLSVEFVRGIAVQLVQALGVSRRIFGFHHNDLLSTDNVRFQQVPVGAEGSRKSWCYAFNEIAFEAVPDYSKIDVSTFSEMTYGELNDVDYCLPQKKHESWCVNADDVDGLRLLLFGFESAALIKPELNSWKNGEAFQNTPWFDDAVQVATIICDILGIRVANFPASGKELCRKMHEGAYKDNILQALKHPFFAPLPNLSEVPASQREVFMFFPNRAGKKENKKENSNGETNSTLPEDGNATLVDKKNIPPPAPNKGNTINVLKPHPPWIAAKTNTDLVLNWPATIPPSGVKAKLFSLQMNGVSVYSGPKNQAHVPGLDPNRCYHFRTSAFMSDGTGWTDLSLPLKVNNCGNNKAIINSNYNPNTQPSPNSKDEFNSESNI